MSEQCTHNCETCGVDCASRSSAQKQQDFKVNAHPLSNIKKVIAVVSGKGGVGKSLVTSLLAVNMNRAGKHSAILDADITGPSIPKLFGIHEKALGNEDGILPCKSKTGIDVMSINLLLENDTDPVVWRGPVIAGTVKQFYTDVIWRDVDFMFVDMPPGTGDVPLTVFQSLPIAGIVVVTSPQDLVSMIVEKAVNMARMMNIPVLGIVENMSYYECPHCGERSEIFGRSHIDETAHRFNIPAAARLPINPKLAAASDAGLIEIYEGDWLNGITEFLIGTDK
ncbi:MAG: P-loop NTPase [Christensenellales bacterium]|nr:Mrp/NBP35 family ATP-binding protein [Clostridium sp.]MDD6626486.1 Mrp/NBP35 family ATP-binding protein [Clostridium sp.]MDY4973923.1 Mrp/NBP35 family ATP-binding protein [Eubacteriales bacterium]HRN14240.1 Mrp/NBP35 family ATP-binding protein [Clostridia bacterium]